MTRRNQTPDQQRDAARLWRQWRELRATRDAATAAIAAVPPRPGGLPGLMPLYTLRVEILAGRPVEIQMTAAGLCRRINDRLDDIEDQLMALGEWVAA